jgi:hypothetical protein
MKGLLIGMLFGTTFTTIIAEYQKNNYTLYKSTDMPHWERSDKDYGDTTVVDTLYFNNKRDTVYRTVQYIRVKL